MAPAGAKPAIPKPTEPDRIRQDIDVLDFQLSAEQVHNVHGLDTGRRGGPDPEDVDPSIGG